VLDSPVLELELASPVELPVSSTVPVEVPGPVLELSPVLPVADSLTPLVVGVPVVGSPVEVPVVPTVSPVEVPVVLTSVVPGSVVPGSVGVQAAASRRIEVIVRKIWACMRRP